MLFPESNNNVAVLGWRRNMRKDIFVLMLSAAMTATMICSFDFAFAQSTDETTEQREFSVQDRKEDMLKRPETAEEIMDILRERAEAKVKEKRKKLFWKPSKIGFYEVYTNS